MNNTIKQQFIIISCIASTFCSAETNPNRIGNNLPRKDFDGQIIISKITKLYMDSQKLVPQNLIDSLTSYDNPMATSAINHNKRVQLEAQLRRQG